MPKRLEKHNHESLLPYGIDLQANDCILGPIAVNLQHWLSTTHEIAFQQSFLKNIARCMFIQIMLFRAIRWL